jgi:hypothetical protein
VRASRPTHIKQKTLTVFIDDMVALLERYACRVLATIWVKGIGAPFKPRETYTQSVQYACKAFQAFLEEKDAQSRRLADH